MINFGSVPASAVLPIFFTSYDANGGSVTLTGLAITDIEIYKGVSMTQRASDAGYTLLDTDGIDVDLITGLHAFSIDLGDNTDAGFFSAGSFYTVVVSAVTVAAQTINFIAATFRIGTELADIQARLPAALTGAGNIKADALAISGSVAAADTLETWTNQAVTGTADSGTTTTMVDAARTEADVDFWKGSIILFTSGNLSGQARRITGFTPSTDTMTFSPAVTQAVATHTYEILSDAEESTILSAALTELAAVPGASPQLKEALAFIYMAVRNRRETTATSDKIMNDAGAAIATATVSDDGTTFVKAEYA